GDSWKPGVASPTRTTLPSESLPTICVADLPTSTWNAPRDVPNPPTWNAGTGSSSTLLVVFVNVASTSQLTVGVCVTTYPAATSLPLPRRRPPWNPLPARPP